ncbi:MAG: protein-glutamate methylesterase/protein-glutamine glutaminase [Acidiferrobacterales bacterium]
MSIRTLIVDDSGFFRRRIAEILDADPLIEVAGFAANGMEAIEQTMQLRPDVITMDIEMPVLDGINAVRRIMASQPTPILMFSSLTHEGAQATLDALDAGAMDYLPKRLEDISRDHAEARRRLCARVRALGLRNPARRRSEDSGIHGGHAAPLPNGRPAGNYRLVLVGASTGGPVALRQVLSQLPGSFPLPLLLVQHMPASFTPAFAQRLNDLCAITVREACDGDALQPGTALLAPGGRQLLLETRREGAVVRVHDSESSQHYHPSLDVTFSSAASAFPGKVLAVVLTGMGADGREGARALKGSGSTVWAQDEASCAIYGMPMAVAEAGLADQVISLSDIGTALARRT